MTEELKIHINPRVAEFTDEIFLYRETGGPQTIFYTIENGDVVERRAVISEQVEPFLKVRRDFAKELVSAMIKYGNEVGIQRPSETKTAGMLEAQTRHLEDLRTMLKLK